jgi:hypothetical protein
MTTRTSTHSSSSISTCRCLLQTTGSQYISFFSYVHGCLISRTAGQGIWVTEQETSVYSSRRAEIPFSFTVTFWVDGRRTSTVITIHDILLKIAIPLYLSTSLTCWFDYHSHLQISRLAPKNQDTMNTISGITPRIIDPA